VEVEMQDRREFLTKTPAFLAVLAAFGLRGGDAYAKASGNTLIKLMDYAITKGSMSAAINKYGNNLSATQKQALSGISSSELEALGSVRPKLRNIGLDLVSAPYTE